MLLHSLSESHLRNYGELNRVPLECFEVEPLEYAKYAVVTYLAIQTSCYRKQDGDIEVKRHEVVVLYFG